MKFRQKSQVLLSQILSLFFIVEHKLICILAPPLLVHQLNETLGDAKGSFRFASFFV